LLVIPAKAGIQFFGKVEEELGRPHSGRASWSP